jgi:hypothetical protein
MICPKCGCRLLWTDGAYCQACMRLVDTRIQRGMREQTPAGGGTSAPNPPCTPPSPCERPADLTYRCEGCGEYLTAQEAASHCRTGGYDRDGNPWPEACGPIHCLMCNGVGSYVSLPGDTISPCPYCSEKDSTRLTAEPVDSGSKDSGPVDGDGERS